MKKQYEKPMMRIDRYELTQSIAACSIRISYTDSQCVIKDPDAPAEQKYMAWDYWFSTGCSTKVIAGNDYDGVCYHTNANAMFNS